MSYEEVRELYSGDYVCPAEPLGDKSMLSDLCSDPSNADLYEKCAAVFHVRRNCLLLLVGLIALAVLLALLAKFGRADIEDARARVQKSINEAIIRKGKMNL